jgi:hypothetical protein
MWSSSRGAKHDPETVGIFLYRAVARLIGVAEAGHAPLQLRSRCVLHLEAAATALYRYFEGHGMWDAAAAFSARANAALFAVDTASDRRSAQERAEDAPGTLEANERAQPAPEQTGVSRRRSGAGGAG